MTTNYIVIPNNCTIKQAMRHLISQAEDNDNIDTIYVGRRKWALFRCDRAEGFNHCP